MALLNYAASIEDLKNINSGYTLTNIASWSDADKVKLILTGDQHIITHGVDLLKDYNGNRGLVPNYPSNVDNYKVLGKNGWVDITTNLLPMASEIVEASTENLLSSKQIVDYVNHYVDQQIAAGFAANDAMVFKGGISELNDITLPYSAGYTYRATGPFSFDSFSKNNVVTSGDIVIAINDSKTGDSKVNPDDFIVVEANIQGTSELSINGTTWKVYCDTLNKALSFYAPLGPGSTGQVLISTKGTPEWKDLSVINAGELNGFAADELLTEVSASNGNIKVTVGGHSESATASGNWNINAASANKVNNALSVGNGLNLGTANVTYDGSVARTLNLLAATTTTIGGVLADNSESPTVTIDNNGKLYLTQQNIINALGYKPTAPNDIMEYPVVNDKEDGIVPAFKTENYGSDIAANFYMLAFNVGGTVPKWCKLTALSLNNTWRPVKVNGEELFNSTNAESNILNLIASDNITLTANNNGILIAAKDTTYTKVTNAQDGLMSKEDFIKLSQIESGALKNVNAFATITAGGGSKSASAIQDTVAFVGENIDIFATTESVKFTVAMLKGATTSANGTAGLVTAPASTDVYKFLKGDGTWATPANDNTWRPIKVGDKSLGTAAGGKNLEIVAGNNITAILNEADGKLTIASSYVNTTYSAGTGLQLSNTQFSLKTATSEEIGGIKIGYTIDGKNYPVQLSEEGKAYVNVPWTDTNIRDILVNGTSIGTKTLNIKPSEEIHIIKDDFSSEDVYEIGFGLSWYNLSDNKYEYSN